MVFFFPPPFFIFLIVKKHGIMGIKGPWVFFAEMAKKKTMIRDMCLLHVLFCTAWGVGGRFFLIFKNHGKMEEENGHARKDPFLSLISLACH